MNNKDLANKYLEYFRIKSDDLFWAWQKVDELCDKKEGVEIAIDILKLCKNNQEICYVAAGPVEDLLKRVGNDVIPIFERESANFENVKLGLSGAWISPDNPVYNEWKRLMVKFGFWGHKPMSPLDRE